MSAIVIRMFRNRSTKLIHAQVGRCTRGGVPAITLRVVACMLYLACMAPYLQAASDTATRYITFAARLGLYGARYSNPSTDLGAHDLVGSAPRDGLHLNIVSGSVQGRWESLYGALTLQLGDYARASWMNDMYWIQEAFIGVHLNHAMRIEAGAFSSHVGTESMDLMENYSGIISLPGFFDPNFFGGVKYLWRVSDEIELQADLVTAFNGFELEEGVPAFATGVTWQQDSTVTMIGNVFVSRETINQLDGTQIYVNTSAHVELSDVHLLGEVNYAVEITDAGAGMLHMISGFAAGYVNVTSSMMFGVRAELMIDPDGILADDRFIAPLPYRSLSAAGCTATISYRPLPWLMIRGDARYLSTLDERSLIEIEPDSRHRTEAVVSIDLAL